MQTDFYLRMKPSTEMGSRCRRHNLQLICSLSTCFSDIYAMQLRKNRLTGGPMADEIRCNIVIRAVSWRFLRNQANVTVHDRRQEALEGVVT